MIRDLIHYNDYYKAEFLKADQLRKDFEIQLKIKQSEGANLSSGVDGLKSILSSTESMLEMTKK